MTTSTRTTSTTDGRLRRLLAIGATALLVPALAGCVNDDEGTDGITDDDGLVDEVEEEVEDELDGDMTEEVQFEGEYDQDFAAAIDDYNGSQVILTGMVETVLRDNAFRLTGDEGTTDAVLVINVDGDDLQVGDPVEVTGEVHETFHFEEWNQDLADDEETDDAAEWEEYEGTAFIEAESVEVTG